MKIPDGGFGAEKKYFRLRLWGLSGAVSAWAGFAALARFGSAWSDPGWFRVAQLGPARPGLSRARPSPDPIPIGLSLTPLGSAWCCPAQFDSAWLGLAWPGPAQIGSAWLGPRRSGDGWNFFSRFFRKFRINRTPPYLFCNCLVLCHNSRQPSSGSNLRCPVCGCVLFSVWSSV